MADEQQQRRLQQQQHRDVEMVFDDWAELGRGDSMASSHEPFTRHGFERLDLVSDSCYLDIGCGNGYTVRWAAQTCYDGNALGIDISAKMVERARELSAGVANATFKQTVFPDPHLENGTFDAILSMEVFYYLPNLDAALRDVVRILKPGGKFACIVDFYAENEESHSWPDDLGVKMNLLGESDWKLALENAGLEVVLQERIKVNGSGGWKAERGSLFTLGCKTL